MNHTINTICDINKESLTKEDHYDNILYLDTSSITCNTISSFQILNKKQMPSRAKRKVKDKTIIYSTVRPNLKHFGLLINPAVNTIVSTGFATLDLKKEYESSINPEYIYYLITNQSIVDYLSTIAESSVSSYPSINPSDIGNLSFEFPCIETQNHIVSVLNPIEKRISLNTRIISELESMAKQLYDYWFVQFDFPDAQGRPYKSSGGKMVWNDKLKREIPEGWEVKNLLYIAKFTNGIACQKFRPVDENKLPVIKIKEMHEGFTKDTEFATIDIPESVKVENGDVLFSWSASLEVMLWSLGNGALNQHIFKVTSSNGFPKSYYYYQLVDYVNIFKRIAEAKKTTMGHITQDHLEQSTIVIPKEQELTFLFEERVRPIHESLILLSKQNYNLTRLRDSLLPMLMNGQVTIE